MATRQHCKLYDSTHMPHFADFSRYSGKAGTNLAHSLKHTTNLDNLGQNIGPIRRQAAGGRHFQQLTTIQRYNDIHQFILGEMGTQADDGLTGYYWILDTWMGLAGNRMETGMTDGRMEVSGRNNLAVCSGGRKESGGAYEGERQREGKGRELFLSCWWESSCTVYNQGIGAGTQPPTT